MGKQTTDFRYNTGATKVPWAAVGENYNVQDLMEIIKFLMLSLQYGSRLKNWMPFPHLPASFLSEAR